MTRLSRAWLTKPLAGLFLLGIIAGCAADGASAPVDVAAAAPQAAAERGPTDPVFTVGYDRMADIYLEAVDLGELTADGLDGLSGIDPDLHALRAGDHLDLLRGTTLVGSYASADAFDSAAWAAIATSAVADAAAASPLVADAGSEAIYEAVFDAIVADLDEYSRYVNAEEAEAERASRDGYGGVGLLLNFDDDTGFGFVEEVFDGSPAEAAGVRIGDVFVAVDGQPTTGWSLQDLAHHLRGPIGTVVTVTVRGIDGLLRTISMRRAQVIIDTVDAEVRDGIGIMRISRFNAGTLEQAREVLGDLLAELRWSGGTGLILDLRGNPGGLLDQSVGLADLFIQSGDIITTRGRHPDSFQRFPAGGGDLADGLPMVVLVDGGSASGAEIVAAALQDAGRAVVVGSSSFGKGSVQTVSRLPNGGELFLTWSRIYGPAGITIHRQGVTPTICTSSGLGDAGTILQAFRSGTIPTPDMLLDQRQRAADDDDALRELREACPWREHDGDLDIQVAIALLEDQTLFARALDTAPAATLAAAQ